MTAGEYLRHFQSRVLQDALSEATSGYWRRRARQFESARPRPGEHQGAAGANEVAGRDLDLMLTALACRRHADLIDSLRPEPVASDVIDALGGGRLMEIALTARPDITEDDGRRNLLDRLRTGAWLNQQHFAPLQWIIPGLLTEGYGMLTGAPKIGKSWLTLDIVLAAAAGRPALGSIPARQRPVLLLALEDGDRRLQDRSRTLLDGQPIPATLNYLTKATPAEVLDIIDHWMLIHGDQAPLVVLDTLGKVLPTSKAGESAYDRDYRIGARLKHFTDSYPGSCLLAVHHTRKMTGEDWMDSTSGTNGLNGAADFTLSLSRARNEPEGILRVTGRDITEGEYAIEFDAGRWSLLGDDLAQAAARVSEVKSTAGLGDQSRRMVDLVNQHPNGISPGEAANRLGVEAKIAGNLLGRLAREERITKKGRGLYTPNESGESGETLRKPSDTAGPQDPSLFTTRSESGETSITDSPLSPPVVKATSPRKPSDTAEIRALSPLSPLSQTPRKGSDDN